MGERKKREKGREAVRTKSPYSREALCNHLQLLCFVQIAPSSCGYLVQEAFRIRGDSCDKKKKKKKKKKKRKKCEEEEKKNNKWKMY